MPAPRSTGLSGVDAQHEFLRARRRATIAKLSARLRGEPDDVGLILPYSEALDALGFVSERAIGLKVVALDAIVETIDRGRGFDRRFRPTSGRMRSRWEQIAEAMRREEPMPPVDLLQIGEIYFVRDGHHRVSVSRALGRADIDANVTQVLTRVDAGAEIKLSDPWDYAELAESVEAWGFRAMRDRDEAINRRTTAVCGSRPSTRRSSRCSARRIWSGTGPRPRRTCRSRLSVTGRLLRTHTWNDDVLQQVIEGNKRRRR